MKFIRFLTLSLLTFAAVQPLSSAYGQESNELCLLLDAPCAKVYAGPAFSLEISGDGSTVVSRERSGALQVLNLQTQIHFAILDAHPSSYERNFKINADGSLLAYAAADGSLRVWDIARNELRFESKRHGPAHSLAFSPDGRHLAAAHSSRDSQGETVNAVVLWNMADMSEVKPALVQAEKMVSGLAKMLKLQYIQELSFSVNGQLLLVGNRDADQLLIVSAESFEVLGSRPYYQGFELSADSRFLLSLKGDTASIDLWEGEGLAPLVSIKRPQTIASAALSRKADLVAIGGFEGSVRLFSRVTGEELQTFQALASDDAQQYFYSISQLAFSQGDRYVIARGESIQGRKLWIWDRFSGQSLAALDLGRDAGAFALSQEKLLIGQHDRLLLQSLIE